MGGAFLVKFRDRDRVRDRVRDCMVAGFAIQQQACDPIAPSQYSCLSKAASNLTPLQELMPPANMPEPFG
jgi:hypothetical protein